VKPNIRQRIYYHALDWWAVWIAAGLVLALISCLPNGTASPVEAQEAKRISIIEKVELDRWHFLYLAQDEKTGTEWLVLTGWEEDGHICPISKLSSPRGSESH
jgi:hypothetical protein